MSSVIGGIGGAVLGAAIIGGAATVYASGQASNASQSASDAATQQQQNALAQQATLSAPYRAVGESAIPLYQQLLGIGKPGSPSPEATLQNTPGYQFTKSQGLDATKAQAGAMGMGLSGNTLTALDQYSTGLADQTYQQAVNNASGAVGVGQAAAAGQAQNVGNAAANTGSIMMGNAANQGNIAMNQSATLAKLAGGAGQNLMTLSNLNAPATPAPAAATGYADPNWSGLV